MHKRLRRAGFEEKDFHTGEVILNYVVGPPSNNQPLVFIHGQSATWEEYTFIMPILSKSFRIYAISLRGHGRSSWTPGQYTFNQLGKDLSTFLREVVVQPAIVSGNSSGGVLAAWLAANAKTHVKAIVLEDPPLFRCDYPNIKTTWVYDIWLAFTRTTVANGGGFAALYRDHIVPALRDANGVIGSGRKPPIILMNIIGHLITLQQVFRPGKPVDFPFLPDQQRIMIRGTSQFDGNFARAFVDGTAGIGFDHAETLERIQVPVLFLHAQYFMREGRLLGALTEDDVKRVQELIKGPWKYIKMNCGHIIPLEAPEQEAREIITWVAERGLCGTVMDKADILTST